MDMHSPLQSSPWSTYMNPKIGSGGTMALMPMSSFDMSHVPQSTFMMGGWKLPSYRSSPSYALSVANTQMGAYSTYYTPSMYPSSTMSVPSNTFSMASSHVYPSVSYKENQFYGSGYPLYGTPSQEGNIYHHLNIPYHTSISLQNSEMMPVQTSLNQLNGGYDLSGQGQGVNQDPSWPAMFQSQYFPGPWNQIPQITASPVVVSHTGAPSPTSVSHVEDGSTTSKIHVDNSHPVAASHAGGTTLITMSHIDIVSPTSIHHVRDHSPTFSCHVKSMSPATVNSARGIKKPRRLRRNPKFLCRTCEGDHLNRLCPATVEIPEAWGSPKGPSYSEASVVSPHLVPPLIDAVVTPLQSSLDFTPIVKADVSPIPITIHPLQPRIEEVVIPMQYLVNPVNSQSKTVFRLNFVEDILAIGRMLKLLFVFL
jgi:hypothetical protein